MLTVLQGKFQIDGGMSKFFIALGGNFVLGQSGAAAGAPGHDIVAFVDQTPVMDFFQEFPDGVVVFRGHGEIGIIPIHPVAEALGLLGLDAGILNDACFTLIDKFFDAIGFDIGFGLETEFFLNLDLDP